MDRQLRAGIVGAGMIADVHARSIRASGGIVASVHSSSTESTASAAAKYSASAAASVDELIDSVDVVHVCVPNAFHADIARVVLAAGKHIVCEKPLATSVADAEQLADAARSAGVVATVPFVYRFYSHVRGMRSRVANGDTGTPRMIHGSYLQDWLASPTSDNWRVDESLGGPSRAFGDIGVHWFDLVEFISGQRVTRITSQSVRAHDERGGRPVTTEDAMTTLFETAGGISGAATFSQISLGRKNRLLISLDGDAQSLEFNQERPDELWVGGLFKNEIIARGAEAASLASAYSFLPSGHPQGYQDAFNAFVADTYSSVLTGELSDGLPTFDDGRRAAVLADAVVRSAASHDWIEVPQ